MMVSLSGAPAVVNAGNPMFISRVHSCAAAKIMLTVESVVIWLNRVNIPTPSKQLWFQIPQLDRSLYFAFIILYKPCSGEFRIFQTAAPTYDLAKFHQKNCIKMKKLDRGMSKIYYVDPSLQ